MRWSFPKLSGLASTPGGKISVWVCESAGSVQRVSFTTLNLHPRVDLHVRALTKKKQTCRRPWLSAMQHMGSNHIVDALSCPVSDQVWSVRSGLGGHRSLLRFGQSAWQCKAKLSSWDANDLYHQATERAVVVEIACDLQIRLDRDTTSPYPP